MKDKKQSTICWLFFCCVFIKKLYQDLT